MKWLVVLSVLALAVVADARADGPAPGMRLAVVGSDGRSVTIELEPEVTAVLFYNPHSVYHVRPRPAAPRGGYARLYPLGPAGFPAIPGRFYPATRALCFDWNQVRAPSSCGRLGNPGAPRRSVGTRRSLRRDRTNARRPAPGWDWQPLRLTRARIRPLPGGSPGVPSERLPTFVATWYGPGASQRPSRICVSHQGVFARGWLYPAGRPIWRLARDVR